MALLYVPPISLNQTDSSPSLPSNLRSSTQRAAFYFDDDEEQMSVADGETKGGGAKVRIGQVVFHCFASLANKQREVCLKSLRDVSRSCSVVTKRILLVIFFLPLSEQN